MKDVMVDSDGPHGVDHRVSEICRPVSWDQPRPHGRSSPISDDRNMPTSSSYTNDSSRAIWQRAVPVSSRGTAPAPCSPRRTRNLEEDNNPTHSLLYDEDQSRMNSFGNPLSLTPPPSPKETSPPSHIVLSRSSIPSPRSPDSIRVKFYEEAMKLNDRGVELHVDCHAIQSHPKPLLFCQFICNKPKLAFGLALTTHLLIVFVSALLYVVGYDILPTNFNSIPLDLRSKDVFLRQEAWLHRDRGSDLYHRSRAGQKVTERSLKYENLNTYIIFEKEGGNVFTKENLKAIKTLEDEFYQDENYQKHFCVLNHHNICERPMSVIRFFDGTYSSLSPVFNDPEFERIPEVLGAANNNIYTKRALYTLLGKNSQIDPDNGVVHSDITRLVLYYGYPLTGFNTTRDDGKDQYNQIESYLVKQWAARWKDISNSGFNGMSFLYMNLAVFWHEVNLQLFYDLLFIGGSFVFIFLFMWFHTHSIWLTCWGMMSTVFSFIGGNLVYNVVVDFKYLGIFHVLSMFIILGIAADDIFIFCDTWRSMCKVPFPSVAHRLSECYRRAARTMFVTSFTTAAAFFINSFSPILAISSFGTFSGITVLMNYLSVILFYPTVMAMWHLNWDTEAPCGYQCSGGDQHPDPADKEMINGVQNPQDSPVKNDRTINMKVTRFLSGPYYNFLMNNIVRTSVLVFFTVLVALFIYSSTTLRPDDRRPRVMKPSHHFEKFEDRALSAFQPSGQDDITKVYIVWGLNLQNRSKCHPRRFADCVGTTEWEDSFDLDPPPAQEALLNFCKTLSNFSVEETDLYRIRRDVTNNQPEVKCFLSAMDDFFKVEEDLELKNGSRLYPVDTNLGLPATELKIRRFTNSHPELFQPNSFHETFYRYFETAYSYWISNRFSGTPTYDTDQFSRLIGEAVDSRDSHDLKGHKGLLYGTRLRYAAVAVNLTLTPGFTYYKDGLNIYDRWESFVNGQVKKMPPSLRSAFQTTPLTWHWFHIQEALVEQGGISVVAGIAVAWFVLVLSSGNFIVGSMATLAIAGITVCVIGCIPLAGWKLGVLEAMNMTLVVGLAIDYVVHLGVAYNHAPFPDRLRRVQHALHELGLSVLCGAITTMGSGLFMMFAQILFFTQFGIFIFATIGFSIMFALTFFLVLLSLIGPQGDTGSTAPLLRSIWYSCIGRKRDDVDCQACEGKGFVEKDPVLTVGVSTECTQELQHVDVPLCDSPI